MTPDEVIYAIRVKTSLEIGIEKDVVNSWVFAICSIGGFFAFYLFILAEKVNSTAVIAMAVISTVHYACAIICKKRVQRNKERSKEWNQMIRS